MKIGDKIGVYLANQLVAEAEIRELEDDKATLIIPATRVVMAVRTSLEPEAGPAPVEPTGNQHVLLGDEREAPGANAPVGDGNNANTGEAISAPEVAPTPAPTVEVQGAGQVPGPAAPESPVEAPVNSEAATPGVANPAPVEPAQNAPEAQ